MAEKKPAAKKAAPKTTATKKTAERIVVDLTEPGELVISDEFFDSWDEAAEEAAIAEAAAAVDVKYVIIEGRTFAGRFPDGELIHGSLEFSVADLESVTAEHDNPVDQLKALFARVGNEASAQALETKNLASVVIYAEKFFNVFAKIAKVALGKSLTS